MPINLLGINHNTAPVEIREQVVIDNQAVPEMLRALLSVPGVSESVVLSTCNRTEIYWQGEDTPREAIIRMLEASEHTGSGFRESLFSHHDRAAAEHLFRVASGLDSMVLGETQITGQLKEAFRLAQTHQAVGPELARAFQQAFSIAKKVRTDTAIGASPVSVAYAAVSLARQLFAGFDSHSALLIGAGDTIELVARHLRRHDIARLFIANRSEERAQLLADEFDGFALPLSRIEQALPDADIVITSTGSSTPIISAAQVREAFAKRRHRPMFIVDIAVPRDVDPAVGELPDVYLYTIDDLNNVVTEGLELRRAAAIEAEQIITRELDIFTDSERQRSAAPTIRNVRDAVNTVRDEALAIARKRIAAGHPVDDVMQQLAHTLTQRILHQPTERLRQAAAEDDDTTMNIARELFIASNQK